MLCNLHTHTTFCDGASKPEEIVSAAINQGFSTIGFSGHGRTDFDLRYCIQDMEGYRREILRLQKEYQDQIQIYLGIEEDAFSPVLRKNYEYIIGSCHYLLVGNEYFSLDSGPDYFERCLAQFESPLAMARAYYQTFCHYIHQRKPDIIGHFDLITKFDELGTSLFLEDPAYWTLAEEAIRDAAKAGCIFEVNTAAWSKGLRTAPYPATPLLRVLKECGAKIILSSDSHSTETLSQNFDAAKALLKEIGFSSLYIYDQKKFKEQAI